MNTTQVCRSDTLSPSLVLAVARANPSRADGIGGFGAAEALVCGVRRQIPDAVAAHCEASDTDYHHEHDRQLGPGGQASPFVTHRRMIADAAFVVAVCSLGR